jgi:DNA-directed RNA polymerase subunit RPC12/RpoP
MYYVKEKINGVEIKIELNDETVYTRCIVCGKEMQIDIVEEIKSTPDFDLYGTGRICCQECSNRFEKRQTARD